MLYTYTAKNKNGETYTGEHEAKSKIDLYSLVREEGGKILSVREKKMGGLNIDIGSFVSRVKMHDKIIFAKNLGAMLGAGLSLTRALDVMQKQAKKGALSTLLHDLSKEVSKGITFSEALKSHPNVFPPIFASMVHAGEESGNLSDSLKVISIQMEKTYTLSKRIKGAMIYPTIILTLMVAIAILLLIFMVPTLTATFSGLGITLPLSTRIIIGASGFLVNNTLVFLASLIGLIIFTILFFKSPIGKRLMDRISVRLPAIGVIVKEVNSARTARTLSSLLSSGVSIVNALEVTESVVENHLFKEALSKARDGIQKGDTISSVLAKYEKIYPPFISEMTAVGEETGKISEMLVNVADFYEADVDDKTKNLSTIIEPMLMIVIGIGVAIFALSMLAPTYSLVNVIG